MPSEINLPGYWDEKYQRNETNWDIKSANPVFIELMQRKKFLNPGKLLIPGCGKGFDAVAAAKNGFEVTALDFSEEAIKLAKELADKEGVNITFLTEDLFELDEIFENYFDSIYEYTTYCAINPERRDEFAWKISSILKPGGKFLTILFPVENRSGGRRSELTTLKRTKSFLSILACLILQKM